MGKNIAIIPARSGSKGLRDKNIKECNGKPLMAYTIEAALRSGLFDCVHVSTDSEKYAGIARDYGADVPFLRSKEMSSDTAGSWDAVKEVLDRYQIMGKTYDMVTLLQPTSPLRDASDIVSAYQLYESSEAKAVISVCEMEHSPVWCNTLPDDKSMEGFIRREGAGNRQRLQQYYRVNGAIYMVDICFLREDTYLYREGSFAYVMDPRKSIDIDTQYDFEMAEYFLKGR